MNDFPERYVRLDAINDPLDLAELIDMHATSRYVFPGEEPGWECAICGDLGEHDDWTTGTMHAANLMVDAFARGAEVLRP